MRVKTEPSPTYEDTIRSPFKAAAIFLLIVSPKPHPSLFRLLFFMIFVNT